MCYTMVHHLTKAFVGIPLGCLIVKRSTIIRFNSHELLDDDLCSERSRTRQRVGALQVEQSRCLKEAA